MLSMEKTELLSKLKKDKKLNTEFGTPTDPRSELLFLMVSRTFGSNLEAKFFT